MELQCSWAMASEGRALACAQGGSTGQPCSVKAGPHQPVLIHLLPVPLL